MRTPSPIVMMSLLGALAAGCHRAPASQPPARPASVAAGVLADTAEGAHIVPAHFDTSAFAPQHVRLAVSPPGGAPPPPEAAPAEAPAPAGAVDRLPTDDRLHPPVLLAGASAKFAWRERATVELDVYVDADGDVADARHDGGAQRDTALVRAAIRQALGLHYAPATQAGRAVAVWCRQRFEAGR